MYKFYTKYMNSPEWQEKRKARLEYDDYECQTCTSKNDLEVHHRTYKNFGNEGLTDLITLCKECHEAISNLQRLKKHKKKSLKLIAEVKNGVSKINVKVNRSGTVDIAQWSPSKSTRLLFKRDKKNLIQTEQDRERPRRNGKA